MRKSEFMQQGMITIGAGMVEPLLRELAEFREKNPMRSKETMDDENDIRCEWAAEVREIVETMAVALDIGIEDEQNIEFDKEQADGSGS